MAALKPQIAARPELLAALKVGISPYGVSANRRFINLLGDGSHHFIKYNAVGEGENIDVTDIGVTVLSFSSIRFPTGVSFWEWEPNGTERLESANRNRIPSRCGFLVVADSSGQRGMMHYADYRPRWKVQGRRVALINPLSATFDLRDNCEPPNSLVPLGDEKDYANAPPGAPETLTAFDTEATPQDAAAIMRHFGIVRSPLFTGEPEPVLPHRQSDFSDDHWKLFTSLGRDLLHEVTPFICMQLVIRAAHARSWKANTIKGYPGIACTIYDTEKLS